MTVTQVQPENTIPEGKYTYVGVDIDTTGRRILDEVRFFPHFFHYFHSKGSTFLSEPRAIQFHMQRYLMRIIFIFIDLQRSFIWPRIVRRSNSINMLFR